MTVEIKYNGQFGNRLFQYVSARLFAEKHGYQLLTCFPSTDVLQTNKPDKRTSSASIILSKIMPRETITDTTRLDELRTSRWARYVFNGYFQDSRVYNNNVDAIVNMFEYPANSSVNTDDVALHCRLGDFYHDDYTSSLHNNRSEIIHPEWFISILEKLHFKKLYILLYAQNTPQVFTDRYISFFKQYNPIIFTERHPSLDFHFIRSFKTVICSNSTFCWWAVFLGKTETAYIPSNIGFFGTNEPTFSHNNGAYELWNIRNISIPSQCHFCDIKML